MPPERRPAIVAVDDEPAVLGAVSRDLRRGFGERYRILRATSGSGALMALLGRRAPEIRHLRRWFRPIVQALGTEHLLIGGWFAASSAGALFGGTDDDATYRYIEVGMES